MRIKAQLGQSEPAILIAWLVSAVALTGIVGCGAKSDLLGVSGEVLLNSAPIKSGSIRFTLTDSEKAIAAEPSVIDGKYAIPQEKGLPPGTYHIMISAVDENAPMVTIRNDAGIPITSGHADLIPAEYNTESDKTVEVTPDGENHFVFDIKK